MSKIAIISQPNEGVLLDVSGCADLKEALEHLSSTLQASSKFWNGMNVSFNVGKLSFKPNEIAQVLAIAKGVGIIPTTVYTTDTTTIAALKENGVALGQGRPMALPEVSIDTANIHAAESDDLIEGKKQSAMAAISVRVKDAISARRNTADAKSENSDRLEDMAMMSDLDTEAIRKNEKKIRKTIVKRKIHITGEFAQAKETSLVSSKSPVNVMEASLEDDLDAEYDEGYDEDFEEEAIELDTETVEDEPVSEQERIAQTTMYLRQNLRSGQTISHKGNLIIIGDVNPGAEIMAEGDITIWGSLRGIAHAGIGGNTDAEIRALNLQPIQIRIAHAIARAPDKPRFKYSASHGPETARLVADKIRVFRSRVES